MANMTAAFDRSLAGGRLRVDVLSESLFHVRFTREKDFSDKPSLMVLPQTPAEARWRLEESEREVRIRSDKLQLAIDLKTGAFAWRDSAGNLLVREPATGGKHLDRVAVERHVFEPGAIQTEKTVDGVKSRATSSQVVFDRWAYQTKLEFVFSEGEAIYGLGQHEDGILNYRGKCQYLYQQNQKVAMPVLVSTRGWGILVDTAGLCTFHDDEHGSYFWTDVDDEMDFYFLVGPEFDQIVAGLRQLTGRPTMLPRWAFGYIQSKERYNTQQELVDITREFRRREIPLDCIVQDWHTWVGELWGDKNPDAERYSDITAAARELHAMNAKFMVSIWPLFKGDGLDQREMRDAGFLLGNDSTYDAFNPAARALYWRQAERGWFRHGVDAWWCDCTEPFEADWKGPMKPEPWKRVFINTQESKLYLDPERINAYSMLHSQGIYEHQRAASPKRVVNLTRSGFPGQHRYGTVTWSGDITATWQALRRQIPEGLNFTVTGSPRWTFDIGGFFVGRKPEFWFWQGDYPSGVSDSGYRELYTRWLQLGAFLPMFRSHGTDTPREPWRFGEPGDPFFDAILSTIRLRYRLLPYIYSLAAAETLDDDTMLRMLAFDFRADPRVHDLRDQFMFGRALMVCPVTEPMYFGPDSTPLQNVSKQRRVYLPAGRDWYDFRTGARAPGGQTLTVDAPLDTIPLFVPAGSILPLGPEVQHAGEKLDAPLELRIYPGRDAQFLFYEDEGDGYGYEQGHYARTPIAWSEATRTLTVGPRQGNYPGMPAQRRFEAVLVGHESDRRSIQTDGRAPARVHF